MTSPAPNNVADFLAGHTDPTTLPAAIIAATPANMLGYVATAYLAGVQVGRLAGPEGTPTTERHGSGAEQPTWIGALATAAQTGQVMVGPYASLSVVNGLVSAGLGDFIWQDGEFGAAGFTINGAGRAQLDRLRAEGWLDAGAQHVVTLVPSTDTESSPWETARWECRCGLRSGKALVPPVAERSGLEHASGAVLEGGSQGE